MAKNAKPRKKYHKKPVFVPDMHNKEVLEEIRSSVLDAELVIENKLPRGTCTDADLHTTRKIIFWAVVACLTRDEYTEDSVKEALELLHKGSQLFTEVQKRGQERDYHFVCTGDELNAIRDAFAFAAPFLRESLEKRPMRTSKEFLVMLHYLDKAFDGEDITLSTKTLRREVNNYLYEGYKKWPNPNIGKN